MNCARARSQRPAPRYEKPTTIRTISCVVRSSTSSMRASARRRYRRDPVHRNEGEQRPGARESPQADLGGAARCFRLVEDAHGAVQGAATRGCSRRPQPAARRPGRSRRAPRARHRSGAPRGRRTPAKPMERLAEHLTDQRHAESESTGGRAVAEQPEPELEVIPALAVPGEVDASPSWRCHRPRRAASMPRPASVSSASACSKPTPRRSQSFEERQHRPTRGGPPLAGNAGAAPVVGQKAWCGARFGAYERSYHSASLRCSVCTCPGGMRL